MFLLSAGVFFVASQFISVVLISMTSIPVLSPVPLMSVPVSGAIPTVPLPRPVTRSVSLLFFAFLLSLPRSGSGPGLGSSPVSIPRPVSVSALLRPWLRSRFTSLWSLTSFFFLVVILEIRIKNSNSNQIMIQLTWLLVALAGCFCWFCLASAALSSNFSLMIFSWLTAILGNLNQQTWPHNTAGTSTYLVSNHSSLVIIALIISPIVMDFPPPAFTSISWMLEIIFLARREIVLGVLEANHSRK